MSEGEMKEWVLKAKTGECEAIYKLWQVYEPLCESWARKIRLTYWDQEDLKQQSYLILLDTLEKYDTEQGMPFGGYYKMRLCIWRNRQLRKRQDESSNVASVERQMENHYSPKEDVAGGVEDKVMAEFILRQLEELSEGDQRLLRRCLVEGKALRELCMEFGLTLEGMKSKKKRSLHKLRQKVLV